MLSLNAEGLLPQGIHDLSLKEVEDLFAKFQKTDRRLKLFARLVELVDELKPFPFVRTLIVNGSFVTSKDQPSDIDLIMAVDGSVLDRVEALNPYEHNAISSRRLRNRYKFDVLVVPEGSGAYDEYVALFSRLKDGPPSVRKGIVRLKFR